MVCHKGKETVGEEGFPGCLAGFRSRLFSIPLIFNMLLRRPTTRKSWHQKTQIERIFGETKEMEKNLDMTS